MGKTAIEWTEETWNPIRGCTRVSAGCMNCYAERVAMRFSGPGQPYEGLVQMTNSHPQWTGKVQFVGKHLHDPLKWKEPRRVFVNSMSDLFHEGMTDQQIDRVFAVMAMSPKHTFQVLTKRPERMAWYLSEPGLRARIAREANVMMRSGKGANSDALAHVFTWGRLEHAEPGEYVNYLAGIADRCWPLPNVWLGVSVENQKAANERISLLLQTPAAVRWISAEPLLGPILFKRYGKPLLDWVVCGGESGPGARPMHPDWARSLRDQCKAAGVAFFFKQWGEWIGAGQEVERPTPDREYHRWPNGAISSRVGKKAAGRLLDGKEHSEYPLAPDQAGKLKEEEG